MRVKEETMAILKQLDVGNELASSLPVLPRASVLIPLTVKNGRLFTLMTLRSREVRKLLPIGRRAGPGSLYNPNRLGPTDLCVRAAPDQRGRGVFPWREEGPQRRG